jgi:flagellar biosynthesis GTPase FlhF
MEKYFVFFRSFHEALECLPRKSYGIVMSAISRYALDGEIEITELKGYEKAVFLLMKPQIDASNRRKNKWNEGDEDRSDHARNAAQARWRKRQAEKPAQAMPENAEPESANAQAMPDYAQPMTEQCSSNAQSCYKEEDKEKREEESSSAYAGKDLEAPADKKVPLIKREPKNDYERVEKRYLENWEILFQRGIVQTSEPAVNYGQTRKILKNLFQRFQPVQINAVLDKAAEDNWILSGGYSLSIILSATVFNRFLNGFEKPAYQKSVYQKPEEEDQYDRAIREAMGG